MDKINERNKPKLFHAEKPYCQIMQYSRTREEWIWFHFKLYSFPWKTNLAPPMLSNNIFKTTASRSRSQCHQCTLIIGLLSKWIGSFCFNSSYNSNRCLLKIARYVSLTLKNARYVSLTLKNARIKWWKLWVSCTFFFRSNTQKTKNMFLDILTWAKLNLIDEFQVFPIFVTDFRDSLFWFIVFSDPVFWLVNSFYPALWLFSLVLVY
jgi:hypothetical protein